MWLLLHLAVGLLLLGLRLTVPIFALRLFLLQRLPVRLRVLLRCRQLNVLIERVVLDASAASGAAADALLRYLWPLLRRQRLCLLLLQRRLRLHLLLRLLLCGLLLMLLSRPWLQRRQRLRRVELLLTRYCGT